MKVSGWAILPWMIISAGFVIIILVVSTAYSISLFPVAANGGTSVTTFYSVGTTSYSNQRLQRVLNDANAALIVPLYQIGANWTRAETALEAVENSTHVPMVVIVSFPQGPGRFNETTQRVLARMQAEGMVLIGYIYHGGDGVYSLLPKTNTTLEIEDYHEWYNLDGIFFDSVNDNMDPYYQNMTAFIHSLGMPFVMINAFDGPKWFQPSRADAIAEENGFISNVLLQCTSGAFPCSALRDHLAGIYTGEATFNATDVYTLLKDFKYVWLTDDEGHHADADISTYIYQVASIVDAYNQ